MRRIGIILYLFMAILGTAVPLEGAVSQPVISKLKATYEHVVSRRFTPETKVWDIRNNVPGEPGVDYPTYATPPETSFTCEKQTGYYADVEARCQVFRVCANTDLTGKGFAFLCPNGTLFNQKYFVCDWWKHVNCSQSSRYFGKNSEMTHHLGSMNDMMDAVQKMVDFTKNNGNPYQMMLRKPSADQNNRGKSSANTSATEANRRGGKLPVTMSTIMNIDATTTPKSVSLSVMPKIKTYVNPITITKKPTSTPDLSQLNPKLLPNRYEKVKTTQDVIDTNVTLNTTRIPNHSPVLLVNFLGETRAAPQSELQQINAILGNQRFTVKPMNLNRQSIPTTVPSIVNFENRRPTQLPPVSAKLPQYQVRKPAVPEESTKEQTGDQNQSTARGAHILASTANNRDPKRPSVRNESRSKTNLTLNENASKLMANTRIGVVKHSFDDQTQASGPLTTNRKELKETITRPKIPAEAIKPIVPVPSRGDQGVDEYENYKESTSEDNPVDSVSELARFDDSQKPSLRSIVGKEVTQTDILEPQLIQSNIRVKQIDKGAVEQFNRKSETNSHHPIISQDESNQLTQTKQTEIPTTNLPNNGSSVKTSLAENINNIFEDQNDDTIKTSDTFVMEPISKDKPKVQQFISNLSEISTTINENSEAVVPSLPKPSNESKSKPDHITIRAKTENVQSNLVGIVQESTEVTTDIPKKTEVLDNEQTLSNPIRDEGINTSPVAKDNKRTDSKTEVIKRNENKENQGTAQNGIYNGDTGDYLLPPNQNQRDELMSSGPINAVKPDFSNAVSQPIVGNDRSNVKISITENGIDIAMTKNAEKHHNENANIEHVKSQLNHTRLAESSLIPPIALMNTIEQPSLGQEVTSGEGNILSHTSRKIEPINHPVTSENKDVSQENKILIHNTRNGLVNSLASIISGKNVNSDKEKSDTVLQEARPQISHNSSYTQENISILPNTTEHRSNQLDLKSPASGQSVFTGDGNLLTQTNRKNLDRSHIENTETVPNGKENVNRKTNDNNNGNIKSLSFQTQHGSSNEIVSPGVDVKQIQTSSLNVDNRSKLQITAKTDNNVVNIANPTAQSGQIVYSGDGNLIGQTNRTPNSDESDDIRIKITEPKNVPTFTGQIEEADVENQLNSNVTNSLKQHEEVNSANGHHVFTGEGNLQSHTSRTRLDNSHQSGQNVHTGEGILVSHNSHNGNDAKQQSENSPNGQHVFSGEGNLQSHTTRMRLNNSQPIEQSAHTSDKSNQQQDVTIKVGLDNPISQSSATHLINNDVNGQTVFTGEGNLLSHTSRNSVGRNELSANGQHVYSGEGNLQSHTTRKQVNNSHTINTDKVDHPQNKSASGQYVFSGEGNLQSHTSRTGFNNTQQNEHDSANGHSALSVKVNDLSQTIQTHNPSGQTVHTGEGDLINSKTINDSAKGQLVFSGEGNLQSHTSRTQLNNTKSSGQTVYTGEGNLLSHFSKTGNTGEVKQPSGDVEREQPLLSGEDKTQQQLVQIGEGISVSHNYRNAVRKPEQDISEKSQVVFSSKANLQSHTSQTRLNISQPIEQSTEEVKQQPDNLEQGQRIFSGEGNLLSHSSWTRLEKPSDQSVSTGEGILLSHNTGNLIGKPQKDNSAYGQKVFSGEGNLQSHTTRTRLNISTPTEQSFDIGSSKQQTVDSARAQHVFSDGGNLQSHQSQTTQPIEQPIHSDAEKQLNSDNRAEGKQQEDHSPKGYNVFSGEGNLQSYTTRKQLISVQPIREIVQTVDGHLFENSVGNLPTNSIKHDELQLVNNESDVILQPIIITSDEPEDNNDQTSKVNENNLDNHNLSEIKTKLNLSVNVDANIPNQISEAVPKTKHPYNEYLPIKGTPHFKTLPSPTNLASDDDALTPPKHSTSASNPSLQPDPVVSDLASWSIQQALNNDRIYRNAGFAERNNRIYRMISNQDIEDINDLFAI